MSLYAQRVARALIQHSHPSLSLLQKVPIVAAQSRLCSTNTGSKDENHSLGPAQEEFDEYVRVSARHHDPHYLHEHHHPPPGYTSIFPLRDDKHKYRTIITLFGGALFASMIPIFIISFQKHKRGE